MVDQAVGQISAEVPDWIRERPRQFWDPGRKLLLTVRRYQVWRASGGVLGTLCCKFIVVRHRFWSVVTGAEIPLICQIGSPTQWIVLMGGSGEVIWRTAELEFLEDIFR